MKVRVKLATCFVLYIMYLPKDVTVKIYCCLREKKFAKAQKMRKLKVHTI